MERSFKRFVSVVAVFLFVVASCVLGNFHVASADEAESKNKEGVVRVYYHMVDGWNDVNIWSWTMETTENLAKNPWPGDEMTQLDDNWYLAEIPTEVNIGVVFANHDGNQTSDCKDLEPGKTYWIVNGSDSELNESGLGGGASLTAFTEPQAGWPEGPAAEEKEEASENSVVLYI